MLRCTLQSAGAQPSVENCTSAESLRWPPTLGTYSYRLKTYLGRWGRRTSTGGRLFPSDRSMRTPCAGSRVKRVLTLPLPAGPASPSSTTDANVQFAHDARATGKTVAAFALRGAQRSEGTRQLRCSAHAELRRGGGGDCGVSGDGGVGGGVGSGVGDGARISLGDGVARHAQMHLIHPKAGSGALYGGGCVWLLKVAGCGVQRGHVGGVKCAVPQGELVDAAVKARFAAASLRQRRSGEPSGREGEAGCEGLSREWCPSQ
eukprot:5850023-Pleurochrysis_carterae.AAC.3